MSMAAAILCAPLQARAAQVIVTTTGIVTSGHDGSSAYPGNSSIFGLPPGTDLTGYSYKTVYTIDDTKGVPYKPGGTCTSGRESSGLDTPIIKAVLTINGASYTFGTLAPASLNGLVVAGNASSPQTYMDVQFFERRDIASPDNFYEWIGDNVYLYSIYKCRNWEDAFSYTLKPGNDFIYSQQEGFSITRGLGTLPGFKTAVANLAVRTIDVSGPITPNPPPTLSIVSPFLVGATDYANLDLATLLPKLPNLASAVATGLAADGASAAIALLSTEVKQDVTFTTNDDTTLLPYSPTFLKTLPSKGEASLKISASNLIKIGSLFYAAALVQSPLGEVKPAYAAPVVITAEQVSKKATQEIKLVPPPVILIHGLWGDATSLYNVKEYLIGMKPWQNWPSLLNTIEYDGGVRFDSAAANGGTHKLDAAARAMLDSLDVQHIVGGRVDVVAHSMGGLVARRYSSFGSYRSLRDRGDGRIYQIVTLNTPETGSPLARFLLDHRCATFADEDGGFAELVWQAACDGTPITTQSSCEKKPAVTVDQCFANPAGIDQPLSPLGQPPSAGAVSSLVPGSPSLRELPSPNIGGASWRAVSSTVSTAYYPYGESALQFEVENLIRAIYQHPASAPTIRDIIGDKEGDDAIVGVSSQISGSSSEQRATFIRPAHTKIPKPIPFPAGLLFDTLNVEDDDSIDELVACWLTSTGASDCIPTDSRAPTAIRIAASTAPVDLHDLKHTDILSIHGPRQVSLATPFEIAVNVPASEVVGLTLSQWDELHHRAHDQPLVIDRTAGTTSYVQATPVLLGTVTFRINALLKDGEYSSATFPTTVRLPPSAPLMFRGDRDLSEYVHFLHLCLEEPCNSNKLQPIATFNTAPKLEINLDGRVWFALDPAVGDAPIRLEKDGSIYALRPGKTTVEVHLGPYVDKVGILVEKLQH